MQDIITLSISANTAEDAAAIAEFIKNYCENHYEDRIVQWGQYVVTRSFGTSHMVYNDAETPMDYFDFETLKENLFERIANKLPDIDFDGSCEYTNNDDMSVRCRKSYENGILLEIPKNKKAKLISCKAGFTGTYSMPSNIHQINNGAFQNCTSLEEVFLCENIKKLGKDTFLGCENLRKVHIPQTVAKITGKTVFKGCGKVTIYAPAGSCAETYAKENNIPFVAE